MNIIILDTNILLDIFVFNDVRSRDLKQAVLERSIQAVASQKTLEEFADVISRPLFKLDSQIQANILEHWQSLATLQNDAELLPAPWKCQDADDQIFLDLVYQLRPAILISKDNAILQLASQAALEDILITSDYNAFKL